MTGMAIGCGGGGGGSQSAAANPSGQVQLTVTPTKTTIAPLAPVNVTATVSGTTETAVTWTVDGVTGGDASVGAISGSGNTITYTAPALPGTHTVAAISTADSAVTDAVVLTVQQGGASGASSLLTLNPANPTAVGSGGQLTFSATGTGSTGDTVTWSVDGISGGNASVGTISAAGVYTCPTVSTPTIHTIAVVSVANPDASASVRILTTAGNTIHNAKTGYGATGNGSTDDTAAINNALAAAAGNICYLPAGTYMINSSANDGGTCAFQPPANTCLYLAAGAILKTITQTQDTNYRVVLLSNNNTSVVGGEIVGDRAARNWTDNAWHAGDGVNIANNSGSVVLGTYIHDNNQDGIYIFRGSVSPTNFTISDVVSDHNRRQALSITEGNTGTFQYSTFSNTNGYTDAGSGVDLEPAVASVTGITINQCSMINNYSTGISGGSSGGACSTVTVKNCTITGNGNAGGIYVNDGADHWTFTSNTLSGNGRDGIRLSSVSYMTVNNNTCNSNAGFGMYFSACDSGTSSYHGNTTSGNAFGTFTDDGTVTAD
jgi:parallel beta-helix repeat protein